MASLVHSVAQRVTRRLSGLVRGAEANSGQTLVVAAIGLSVIVTFLGLAVDVGHLRYVKRNLQGAADAAALAAAIEVQLCGGVHNCAAMQAAAQGALTENGFTGATLVTNCGSTPGPGLTLMVNNPTCALGATDPNSGNINYVEVEVSQTMQTYFGGLVGWNNVPLMARAEAARAGGSSCIFALDPTGTAITVGVAVVSANCGIVDESSSASALYCPLLGSLTATQINVVGGVSGGLGLCAMSPSPNTGVTVPTPADPLSYLPKPTVPACGTSTSSPYHGATNALTINGTATLYPDAAYCGGITLGLGANVTFSPGTYVLTSSHGAGGLSINLGATAYGTGVTFYNYGPTGGVTFGLPLILVGNVSLSAPTSGTYEGILFFQDPGNTSSATILGTTSLNTVLNGAYYFPAATVNFGVSGTSNYNILVAKDINFLASLGLTTLQSTFAANYNALVDGSPVAGTGSVLVQ